MSRPYLPTMGELADLAGDPRVHPNGFIQLDLDPRRRLHVWHPRLPFHQKSYSPVHDHIFSFESHVFSGRLVHVEYELGGVVEGRGTHRRWQVSSVEPGENSILRPVEDEPARHLIPSSISVVQPGESYHFAAFRLHESLSNEPTLTVMVKDPFSGMRQGTNCLGASVMVPVGSEPDNDFRRDAFDTDLLWELIAEAHPC